MSITHHTILLVEGTIADADLARAAAAQCQPEFNLQVFDYASAVLDYLAAAGVAMQPFIILINLDLPKLEGLAVLRTLRINPLTRDIPVLVYSRQFNQAEVLLSYSAGANSFVPKPQDEAEYLSLFASQLTYWLATRNWQFNRQEILHV
ncbi:MAG: response regulator [Gallionella sp.]